MKRVTLIVAAGLLAPVLTQPSLKVWAVASGLFQ